MLESFFSKNNIKINKVDHGSHGDHWSAFFWFENLEIDVNILMDRINHALEDKKSEKINNQYSLVKESLENIEIKIILNFQEMASCFPVLNSNNKIPFFNTAVNERAHVDNIEAQIIGSWRNTFGLNFFATDYLENKKVYHQTQNLEVNLSGFAYVIQESQKMWDNISEDFVWYIPSQQTRDKSVYDFIGTVIDFKEYSFENIEGFIIKTKLINQHEMEDFFVLDIFVNKQNLRLEKLEKNMKISWCFWLQGNIAKN